MRVEWRLFAGAAVFFSATTAIYWLVSYEDAGTTMLGASVPAFALVAGWLWFQHRRVGLRPADRPDASPADGTGEVGYFPASSAWPFVLAAGVVVVANGLVFGPPIAVVGALLMLAGVFGYAREADLKD